MRAVGGGGSGGTSSIGEGRGATVLSEAMTGIGRRELTTKNSKFELGASSD
jgi:hypothetical protein